MPETGTDLTDNWIGLRPSQSLVLIGMSPLLFARPYTSLSDPEKAPESISRAVASLPPEQMFELMKQMKTCIQQNPEEAKHMLLKNPQLSYALLQALVVMR